MGQLGWAPLVATAVSLFTGKKGAETAARHQEYAANEQQILSGQAIKATDVMTPQDMAIMRDIWPKVRAAATWPSKYWGMYGIAQRPALTPAAEAAIAHVWPAVRVAAKFDDVNWQYAAVPIDVVARLLPVPEMANPLSLPRGSWSAGIPTEWVLIGGTALAGLILLINRR